MYPIGFCIYIVGQMNDAAIPQRTYVGYTNNFARRIRQHRKEITGGAKCTSRWINCHPLLIVSGFPDNKTALKYEWRLKRLTQQCKSKNCWQRRCLALGKLLTLERATKTAPSRMDFEQSLFVHTFYHFPDEIKSKVTSTTLVKFQDYSDVRDELHI